MFPSKPSILGYLHVWKLPCLAMLLRFLNAPKTLVADPSVDSAQRVILLLSPPLVLDTKSGGFSRPGNPVSGWSLGWSLGASSQVSCNLGCKWIKLTYPIYSQGYNLLSKWDEPPRKGWLMVG